MPHSGQRACLSTSDMAARAWLSLLRTVPETASIPLSPEWSVPYHGTVFHLGVHNLPDARAQEIMADLKAYTRNPSDGLLLELLAMLIAVGVFWCFGRLRRVGAGPARAA